MGVYWLRASAKCSAVSMSPVVCGEPAACHGAVPAGAEVVEAGGEQDRINRIYRIGDGRVLVEGIGKMLCGLYVPCG